MENTHTIKKKHRTKSKKEKKSEEQPLQISYLGGLMYLDKEKSLKNGLKIFNEAYKGQIKSVK